MARVMESHRLDPDTVMLFPGGGEAPLGVALGLCRLRVLCLASFRVRTVVFSSSVHGVVRQLVRVGNGVLKGC